MIDPILQHVIDQMAESGFALPEPMTAESMRAVLDMPIQGEPIPVGEVRDVTVAGADGTIAARLYHPAPGEERPLAVMMHGGGWVIGTLDTHDGLARVLARESGCAILSLAYRLAPEHPYPAPLNDCLAAVRELPSRAKEFGVRAGSYAVVGDSAGGNLAAALSIALAGSADAPVCQVLLYPVIDRDFETASYRNAPEGGFLNTDMMRFFWQQYVGDAEPDGLAAPIRTKSLSGVAPATIILAGNDPLHDEGFAYAVALREAGVPTNLHDFAGGIHGFASMAGVAPIADQAVGLAAAALRQGLAAG
jgi:acetyl esterase|tara:strand:- start:16413 stop:17330 length:918 start_codon:yes stop_codon:yes gene_type:complete